MTDLFDPNPNLRSATEWRSHLSDLVVSLSKHTNINFNPTSWWIHDDCEGDLSSCNCVDIYGVVNTALQLEAYGVVCISVNFGEAVWASADILLFGNGHRIRGSNELDLVLYIYQPNGWISKGWILDENYEWESYLTADRWKDD